MTYTEQPLSERAIGAIVTPPSWRQVGVIVADASPSMSDQLDASESPMPKAQAAGLAVSGLVSRFAVSRKRANFSFAGITFASEVTSEWGPTPAAELDTSRDYDPSLAPGNGTRLAAGLERAAELVEPFLAETTDGLPSSAVVLLLTDGQCQDVMATRAAAQRLKADPRVKLACAFFATRGAATEGLALLQEICSDPATVYCKTVYDAETLRSFWQASMTVASSLPAVAALPPGGSMDLG